MKLGRFVVQDLDGPVHRLCMVLPQQQRVIDLRAAEILRQMDRGATREAAQRYASAALLASLLHDGVLTVEEIKTDLLARGLPLRPLEPALAAAGHAPMS